MEERAKCQRCNMYLTVNMDIEYSKYLGDVFCSPACATDYYFDYMKSTPTDCRDLNDEELKERGIKLIDGVVYVV